METLSATEAVAVEIAIEGAIAQRQAFVIKARELGDTILTQYWLRGIAVLQSAYEKVYVD